MEVRLLLLELMLSMGPSIWRVVVAETLDSVGVKGPLLSFLVLLGLLLLL